MGWRAIAHKDVHDASRSRTLWALFALLSVLFVGFAAVNAELSDGGFVDFLDGLAGLVGVFLPILGILLGYKSVSEDRSDGSIYLSLSFPHSRSDLVVGTVVGRSVVLLAPTLFGLVLAGILGAVLHGTDGAVVFPWFLLVTALYGVAFVAFAVGLSLSTTVDRRITFGALGGYLLLVQLWDNLVSLTVLVLHRFESGVLGDLPDWALLFRLVKPSESYYRLLRAVLDVERAHVYVGSGTPAYVDWWMALLMLVAWVLVPLVLGYRRFATADL